VDAAGAADLRVVRFILFVFNFWCSWMVLFSVNKSLKGKWASLACHETGSLVVQARRVLFEFELS
jgi:hypothetical protein